MKLLKIKSACKFEITTGSTNEVINGRKIGPGIGLEIENTIEMKIRNIL